MVDVETKTAELDEMPADAPSNWGRWGNDDEIGCLNFLTPQEVLRCWLDPLAADCADDGQYTFLYAAAPLNIVGGTGAPVNPLAVK